VGSVLLYGLTVTALTGGIFGTLLLGIGVTDARTYLIPDEYTWGGLGLGLVLSVSGGLDGFLDALLGAAAGFALLYLIAVAGEKLFKKEAMGGGDIKMMAMVGAFLGWQGVPLTIFGGALLGTLVFLPLQAVRVLVAKAKGRETNELLVPFGVFLSAAAAGTFVVGDWVVDWYLGYLGVV
jgi:leader peptidase (prepilin peptidase)/N-methyltransferase